MGTGGLNVHTAHLSRGLPVPIKHTQVAITPTCSTQRRRAAFLLQESGLKHALSPVLRLSFRALPSRQGTLDDQFLVSSDFIWEISLIFSSPAGILVGP